MHNQHTPKTTYFQLRDNHLSVKGGHPRSGDLCAAVEGEGAEGELHLIKTDSYTYAGRLHRKGGSVIIRYPNGTSTTLLNIRVEAVYRITQFFHAQDALTAPQAKPRTSAHVVCLTDWRATRHLTS